MVIDDQKQRKIFIAKEYNNQWEEIKKSCYPSLEVILKNADSKMFWQFYSKEDDIKYPNINKLKLLTKDENGVLNIKKLAKVLEENKSVLAKYLNN